MCNHMAGVSTSRPLRVSWALVLTQRPPSTRSLWAGAGQSHGGVPVCMVFTGEILTPALGEWLGLPRGLWQCPEQEEVRRKDGDSLSVLIG